MYNIGVMGVSSAHSHVFSFTLEVASQSDTRVYGFTTTEHADKVRNSLPNNLTVEWVIKNPTEDRIEYFKRIEREYTPKLDILIINTISNHPIEHIDYLRFSPSCPTLSWIYSANKWFDQEVLLTHDIKKLFYQNTVMVMKKLMKAKLDGLIVEHKRIKRYLDNKRGCNRRIHHMTPVNFNTKETASEVKKDDKLLFTIPGAVLKTRDYKMILDIFSDLFETYENKIALSILGSLTTSRGSKKFKRKVIKKCKILERKGYDIRYFPTDWISHDTFNEVLLQTDLVLSPIQKFTLNHGISTEYMGITHGTGAVFDALRFGKPILLPENYTVSHDIRPISHTYEDQEGFMSYISAFIENMDYRVKTQQDAEDYAQEFSLSQNKDRFRTRIITNVCKEK